MTSDIFVSVGRTSTPEQEQFVASIEQLLKDHGLNPRTVGRTDFSSRQPLLFIGSLMQQCAGTVVIAFERLFIIEGIERRGGENEKEIRNESLPTVWNQIEAAMAYVHQHPLLVIVEKGLRKEGLLETGYDWYVMWVDLDTKMLESNEFKGVFLDWKRRVEQFRLEKTSKDSGVAPSELTIRQILGSLKPAQLWALIVALALIVAAAFRIGAIYSSLY